LLRRVVPEVEARRIIVIVLFFSVVAGLRIVGILAVLRAVMRAVVGCRAGGVILVRHGGETMVSDTGPG